MLREIASQYGTRTAFSNGDRAAYAYACNHKLLDEICQHMPCTYKRKKTKNSNYSLEDLHRIANKYEHRVDFCKHDRSAYLACLYRGILDEVCKHMTKPDSVRKYTNDDLLTIGQKYETRYEFCKNDHGAYQAARERGILDYVCDHMPKNAHELERLSREQVTDAARSSCGRWDFHQRHSGAAHRAIKDGYFSELEQQMVDEGVWEPITRLTFDEVSNIASQYETKKEFKEKDYTIYAYARHHKWLKDVCKHMKKIGNWYYRKIYAFEFSDGYAYVGLTYDLKDRKRHHLYDKSSPVGRHIKKTGAAYEYKELTGWISIDIVGDKEDEYINKYRSDGWKMLNRRAGGSLGYPKNKRYKKGK